MQSVSSRIWTRIAVFISYGGKIVLDAALISTLYYKVTIMGKVKQSREWSFALTFPSV